MAPNCARRTVLRDVCLSAIVWHPSNGCCASRFIDPLYSRLRNHYILLRPGETTFEAANLVDSNPINKGASDRGLTPAGCERVRQSAVALRQRGISSPIVFYDNGARASQTADILARELSIPRARMEPEFRWLEARGLGALDGTELDKATAQTRTLDAIDFDNAVDESDDGTPSDSINDVFVRTRNTISKIETCYSGDDVIVIGGDAYTLSVLAAASCGIDLSLHAQFTLPPGAFYDLRELTSEFNAGTFKPAEDVPLSEESVNAARAALRDLGPRLFGETAAGSWVLGPNVRR